mmetsp:Transcript_25144/g.63352  ORF Transcript_25144/g.63352 Transcript_25144/m.63352 type:complete len:232 (+) Transcript_25144:651-1346(+)
MPLLRSFITMRISLGNTNSAPNIAWKLMKRLSKKRRPVTSLALESVLLPPRCHQKRPVMKATAPSWQNFCVLSESKRRTLTERLKRMENCENQDAPQALESDASARALPSSEPWCLRLLAMLPSLVSRPPPVCFLPACICRPLSPAPSAAASSSGASATVSSVTPLVGSNDRCSTSPLNAFTCSARMVAPSSLLLPWLALARSRMKSATLMPKGQGARSAVNQSTQQALRP